MRRFATAAAAAFLALPALTLSGTAHAAIPGAQWVFTGNYPTLEQCHLVGQQLVTGAPQQDRASRCDASTANPSTWDLWILYLPPR